MATETGKRHQRDLYLRRTYGITIEDYEAIREYQNNKCPPCGKELPENAPVDHDHSTGVIRGILCGYYCNNKVVGRHRDWRLMFNVSEYLRVPPAVAALGVRVKPKKKRRKKKVAKKGQ